MKSLPYQQVYQAIIESLDENTVEIMGGRPFTTNMKYNTYDTVLHGVEKHIRESTERRGEVYKPVLTYTFWFNETLPVDHKIYRYANVVRGEVVINMISNTAYFRMTMAKTDQGKNHVCSVNIRHYDILADNGEYNIKEVFR